MMTSNEQWQSTEENNQWSFNEERMLKYMLEKDGIQFMRYFFKIREGNKMECNWHHYLIQYVLQAVLDCKVERLIINIAPGYTKTELAVINFITRGIAINHRAKFIHASYSRDLVLENSSKIKDTILTEEFQKLWPMKIRTDKKSKAMWFTDDGGGMLAAATSGQITGFRAGRMQEGFTGAFIIDDPLKPDDGFSTPRRTTINTRFNNTMRSRLALETVPMIVIMQRIHEDDLSGYLLKGGSGDMWHHLTIPTLFSEEILEKPYPEEYTHGKKVDINALLDCMHKGLDYDFQR